MTLHFRVHGTPAPKGSTRAFVVKGRAIVTEANAKTRPWAALVKDAARQAFTVAGQTDPWTGPVSVRLEFALPPPKSLAKRKAHAPCTKPDADKLTRTVFDALTGLVWRDDSQVVAYTTVKAYGVRPGVTVTVFPVDPDGWIFAYRPDATTRQSPDDPDTIGMTE